MLLNTRSIESNVKLKQRDLLKHVILYILSQISGKHELILFWLFYQKVVYTYKVIQMFLFEGRQNQFRKLPNCVCNKLKKICSTQYTTKNTI